MNLIQKQIQKNNERCGNFSEHAKITQQIKVPLVSPKLEAHHKEALAVIAFNLGAIVNGDPNAIESWMAIGSYAENACEAIRMKPTNTLGRKA